MKNVVCKFLILFFVLVLTAICTVGCQGAVSGITLSLGEADILYDESNDISHVSVDAVAEIKYMMYCVRGFSYRISFFDAEGKFLCTKDKNCDEELISIEKPTATERISFDISGRVESVFAEPLSISTVSAVKHSFFDENGIPKYSHTYWNFVGWIWVLLAAFFAVCGIINFIRLAVGVFDHSGVDALVLIFTVVPPLITAVMLIFVF